LHRESISRGSCNVAEPIHRDRAGGAFNVAESIHRYSSRVSGVDTALSTDESIESEANEDFYEAHGG
jgi:hypothetical protein